LLCDVALGSSYETKKPEYMEKPPPGKHSTYAQARFIPDPTSDEIGEERVIIPLGKPVESNLPNVFLEYPEYVVYNPSQVRIRYLLKVQFLFNKKSEQNSTI
jgi:poly [ADP-ribose] polymerase